MIVEVRVSDSLKGKGLFAKSAIPSGSVIFEEDPLVSCQLAWNAEYRYLACDHCLRPLETAQENAIRLTGHHIELPYSECCTTDRSKFTSCSSCGKQYCSEECRTDAFKQYHQTLCTQSSEGSKAHPLEQLNEAWKQVHYPPETNNIQLIVRLLARILQASDKGTAITQTLQFCHRTINEDADLSHKLLGEKFSDQLPFLHSLLVASVPHEGIEQFLTFEGFQSLLALIGTNGQGVGTSAISQWAANVEKLPLSEENQKTFDSFLDDLYQQMETQVGDFLNNEGVALYTLQSTCNHSCRPNAEPRFMHNNHRLSLVATEDIHEGEEIFISYLDECMLNRSRYSRRKELTKNYLFVCHCVKCEEEGDQQDFTSDEEEESMSD